MPLEFDALFDEAASHMEAIFRGSRAGVRADEKGRPREAQLREFLKAQLPSKYSVSSGYVIDIENKRSTQCDIIIYDSSRFPSFFVDNGNSVIIPIEDVYSIIEVKSKLSKDELEKSILGANSVFELFNTDCSSNRIDESNSHKILARVNDTRGREIIPRDSLFSLTVSLNDTRSRPCYMVFAYDFDNSLTFDKIEQTISFNPRDWDGLRIDVVSVLSSGTIYHADGDKNKAIKSIETGDRVPFVFQNEITSQYMRKQSNESKVNLMIFFSLLLSHLSKHRIVSKYDPIEYIAKWRKGSEK